MEEYWASVPVIAGEVNPITGNFIMNETDLILSGRGPNIEIARTYNSQNAASGMFGTGWSSTLDVIMTEEQNGDVLYLEEDGTIHRFQKIGDNIYQAPTGLFLTLKKENGVFSLKDKDQNVIKFNAEGKLDSITDRYSTK